MRTQTRLSFFLFNVDSLLGDIKLNCVLGSVKLEKT